MEKTKYKIICITQIYNELEKGNLRRFIKYVEPLCDVLIVYDDGSTDGSVEYVKRFTPHVIRGKKNDFENEIAHKQLLIDKAKKLKADFIFYLDADEVLTVQNAGVIQKLAQRCVERDIDGLQFHKINLWRSNTWQRTDSLFNIGWFTHFWRVTPEMKYLDIKKGLHQSPYPSTVKKIERTNKVAVLHYGFASEKNIANKYLTYKSFGQRGYVMLDRLISEEKLQLKKVPAVLFPEGLYVKNEQKPRNKTFFESLEFVETYRKEASYQKKITIPIVSIITPVFNAVDYIEETVRSIVSQDYPKIEYIVIDDGSTDKTLHVLKKYKRKLKIVTQKNSGEAAAVNKGVSFAKGKYIMVVNADDPLLPGAISVAVSFMEKHKDVLVGYPDWYMIDAKSKVIRSIKVPDHDYINMVKEHYCYIGPGAIITAKAFKLVGYRDPAYKYVGDFDFWLRLGRKGKFARIPDILATWRLHNQSTSQIKKGRKMANEHIQLTKKLYRQKNLPVNVRNSAKSAWSATYYHAASLHGSYFAKGFFYFKSFLYDPRIFFTKVRYELVKIKQKELPLVNR